MPILLDSKGNAKQVDKNDIGSYLKNGYRFGEPVVVEDLDGNLGEISQEDANDFFQREDNPYSYISKDELADIRANQKYGDIGGQAQAFGEGVASGLTFGLSDEILKSAGVEGVDERKRLGASTAGEIASFIAPYGSMGKVGKVASAGIRGLEKGAEKVASKLTTDLVKSKLGKGALSGATRGALEGGGYEAIKSFNEQAFGDSDFNGEAIIARAKDGIKYGAGLGALFGGAGVIAKDVSDSIKAKKVIDENLKKYKLGQIDTEKTLGNLELENTGNMRAFPNIKATYDQKADKFIIRPKKNEVIELKNDLTGIKVLDLENSSQVGEVMDSVGFFDYEKFYNPSMRSPQIVLSSPVSRLKGETLTSIGNDISKLKSEMVNVKKGWNRLRGKKVKSRDDLRKIGKLQKSYAEKRKTLDALTETKNSYSKINRNDIYKKVNSDYDAILHNDNLHILKPEKFDHLNVGAYKNITSPVEISNSKKYAIRAMGVTPSAVKKMRKSIGDKRTADVAGYASEIIERTPFFSGLDDVFDVVQSDMQKSVVDMDTAINNIDTFFAETKIDPQIDTREILNRTLFDIKESLSYPNGTLKPENQNLMKKAIDEIRAIYKDNRYPTFKELREVRKSIDDQIKFNSTAEEFSFNNIKKRIRRDLENALISKAEKFDELSDVVNKYKKAKDTYSNGMSLSGLIEYGLSRQDFNNKVGLTSYILAGDLASSGASIPEMISLGSAGIAGREFIRSHGDKIMALYGDKITSTVTGIKKTINKSVKNFLNTDTNRMRLATTSALTREDLTSRNLDDYKAEVYDIKPMIERYTELNKEFSENFPMTSNKTMETMLNGIKFLNSKKPIDPYGNDFFNRYTPPETEMRKFERYKKAVSNPLNILKELNEGSLSIESTEVLRSVYPNLYNEIKVQFVNELSTKKVDYRKRQELSKIFGVNTSYYLEPANISILQQSAKMINQENNQGVNINNSVNMDKGNRLKTDSQSTEL